MAFITRLSSTCCNWMRSPKISGTSSERCVSTRTPWRCTSLRARARTSRMAALRSSQAFWGGGTLGESANASDDVAGALAVGDHPQGGLPGFLQVLGGEPAHAGTGVIDQGAERLIDFVRDRRAQLAQRRHPCHVGQLRLRVVQCLFSPLALGDVITRL